MARPTLAFFSTYCSSTSPAPSKASIRMSTRDTTRVFSYAVSLWKCLECPDYERDDTHEGESAGYPVSKLDDRLRSRSTGNHHSVAERPVRATTGAGSCCSDKSAPEDHDYVPAENNPGEQGKSRRSWPQPLIYRGDTISIRQENLLWRPSMPAASMWCSSCGP